jgi:FAD binding domain/Berberine and berberine like
MNTALRRALEQVCPKRVVAPEHPWYDNVRQLFNGMYDTRPALICLPKNTAEVRSVIRHARDAAVPTAVRGGGHNIGGAGSVSDGLVIDLRLLNRVTVLPVLGQAQVGGGATWADFDMATSAYGLASTGGTFDTTGVGGLTLGGGIGHLMGCYGLACDNVASYRLVTADGDELLVDAETQPELNWALRGAGHHFGVVTEFIFDLHPVTTLYGGYVAYPGRHAGVVVRMFRDLMIAAPDELTCTLLLERYGPTQVPAAVISVAYHGQDLAYRNELDRTLRGVETLDWRLEWRSYVSMQTVLGRLPFGLRHYWSARCVDGLPDALADALIERFEAARITDPFNDTVLIEPIHGRVRGMPAEATAVPFREARFNITGMAIWQPAEANDDQIGWARSVAALAEPHSRWGDGYVNYVSDLPDDGAVRAVRTFGASTYQRLLTVKSKLDPDNFFHSSYALGQETRA